MKPNLAVLLLLLPLGASLNAKDTLSHQPEATELNEAQSPAAILAAQVQDIAASSTISRKSQAKLITNAIRRAITAATEGIKDPAQRLQIALELTTAAAKAAPHFAATITRAVTGLPALAKIEGALEQIQAAVKAGIETEQQIEIANPAVNARHHEHEFDGPDKGERVVSGSGPAHSSTSGQSSGSFSVNSSGADFTTVPLIGAK